MLINACRPEAVNISNVAALVDAEGKPHFKYVVEGANLFFTQQARLALEKRKVILFKDSSANKGGVTSSRSRGATILMITRPGSCSVVPNEDVHANPLPL